MPELTALFRRSRGWTGADGAYSVRLDRDRTLWTFGDTWVGRIEDGKRTGATMINNSAAWQSLAKRSRPPRFFWREARPKPQSLIPAPAGTYYWPGDAVVADGKLCLFLHRVRNKPDNQPPFQFEELTDDLAIVSNPDAEPTKWNITLVELGNDSKAVKYGVACLKDGQYVYVFCSWGKGGAGVNKQPLIVARAREADLAGGQRPQWQYWSEGAFYSATRAGRWSESSDRPIVLFADAAPEMSVGRVPGIPGFVATYMPAFSRQIMVRHAPAPEGPWSEPTLVYKCPENEPGILLYSAKAHADLSEGEGDLVITYCRNTAALLDHILHPQIYFPQAVRAMLKYRGEPLPPNCNCHPLDGGGISAPLD